jgi:putative transposase
VLTGLVKDLVEHDIRQLSEWKSCEVIELNVQADHVHLVVSIPPKVSVSELVGTLKGKLAIKLFNRTAEAELPPTEAKSDRRCGLTGVIISGHGGIL